MFLLNTVKGIIKLMTLMDLQYKMFLLNLGGNKNDEKIKLHLQYKMFLLNFQHFQVFPS